MISRFRAAAAFLPALVLAACTADPRIETGVSGAVPAGSVYGFVDGAKYFGAADVPVERLEQCLGSAGLRKGGSPELLVQVAHTIRPANARLLQPGDTAAPARRQHTSQEREELVVAVTNAVNGTVLYRASAARILQRGEVAGTGVDLADAVCKFIPQPVPAIAAGPR